MVHRLQDDSYCGSGEVGGWDGEEESYGKMWVIVKALVWVVVLQEPI